MASGSKTLMLLTNRLLLYSTLASFCIDYNVGVLLLRRTLKMTHSSSTKASQTLILVFLWIFFFCRNYCCSSAQCPPTSYNSLIYSYGEFGRDYERTLNGNRLSLISTTCLLYESVPPQTWRKLCLYPSHFLHKEPLSHSQMGCSDLTICSQNV